MVGKIPIQSATSSARTTATISHEAVFSCVSSRKGGGSSTRSAAENGFLRSTVRARMTQLMGRKWGRTRTNRESDTPQGTGQLPACELMGWPNVEAQGVDRATTDQPYDEPARVVNPLLFPAGEGGPTGELLHSAARRGCL
jgi:hypothetical protein